MTDRLFPAHFEVARDERDDGNPMVGVIITLAFEAIVIALAFLIWALS